MRSIHQVRFNSPLGPLLIKAENDFITQIVYMDPKERILSENKPTKLIKECIAQLEEYFKGARKKFTIPLSPEGTPFEKSVWNELMNIPWGRTISYEDLARLLGDLKKIRAVGRANGKNPVPIIIPCHRVIGKNGSLVGYAGGVAKKEFLLIHEGVIKKQVSLFN